MDTYQLAVISVGNCKYSTGNYYSIIIMTSKLNLIKIRLINFDFGKRLKILRGFPDVTVSTCDHAYCIHPRPLVVLYLYHSYQSCGSLLMYYVRHGLSCLQM